MLKRLSAESERPREALYESSTLIVTFLMPARRETSRRRLVFRQAIRDQRGLDAEDQRDRCGRSAA